MGASNQKMSPIPVPVPPELRPRGPKSVRGPSPVHPVAAPTDKYSSLSEETDSVAARVKKRLQRVRMHLLLAICHIM